MSEVWYTATQPALFPPVHMLERYTRVHDVVLMDQAQIDRKTLQVNLTGANGPMKFSPDIEGSSRVAYADAHVRDSRFIEKLRKATDLTYGKFVAYKSMKEQWHTWLDGASSIHSVSALCYSAEKWVQTMLLPHRFANIRLASKIIPQRPTDPTEWIVQLGQTLKATDYVQGLTGVQGYLRLPLFQQAGIRLWAQEFAHPFNQKVSILDVLFTMGPPPLWDSIKPFAGHGNIVGTMRRFV